MFRKTKKTACIDLKQKQTYHYSDNNSYRCGDLRYKYVNGIQLTTIRLDTIDAFTDFYCCSLTVAAIKINAL